ncbi:MAG: methionine adenosyltransferase [Planctomycetes bacterium]|nr:methionine adenosyltransferase [Planctomycetota bacterium]
MNNQNFIFTSESVSQAHPDKVADTIADSILDAYLAFDPDSRVACEVFVTTDYCLIAGEITSKAKINAEEIARKTICEIGYDSDELGFNGNTCKIDVRIHEQSSDISQGVDTDSQKNKAQGAGDQGMMFGFACNDTTELFPLPAFLSHKMMMRIADLRKNREIPWLRPDSKGQITVEYEDGCAVRVKSVVLSTQHDESVCVDNGKGDLDPKMRELLINKVVKPIIPERFLSDDIEYFINPTGRFVQGGPHADCGLTGRKIIVDTYGGMGRHGGGSFSGKDSSKVDRSATYFARYIAKNIVKAGLADKCEVQIAYAIGIAEPVSVMIDTFNTGKLAESKIIGLVKKHFDMRPAAIIQQLMLKRPIYKKTAAYGHFGRNNAEFTWENTDKAEILRKEANL